MEITIWIAPNPIHGNNHLTQQHNNWLTNKGVENVSIFLWQLLIVIRKEIFLFRRNSCIPDSDVQISFTINSPHQKCNLFLVQSFYSTCTTIPLLRSLQFTKRNKTLLFFDLWQLTTFAIRSNARKVSWTYKIDQSVLQFPYSWIETAKGRFRCIFSSFELGCIPLREISRTSYLIWNSEETLVFSNGNIGWDDRSCVMSRIEYKRSTRYWYWKNYI